tara:strand:+ start:825 stop:1511 length:687 start_codon:yes stop_codon:yes gene_type:complete
MLSPLIVALDLDLKDALILVDKLDPRDCRLKVGSQLFTANGPEVIGVLKDRGFEIFLDLKFHDIPNTVSKALTSSIKHGVWMINVHASGGKKMLEAASLAVSEAKLKPILVGVTLLTSLDRVATREIGFKLNLEEQVIKLARLCKEKGLDGVVCSPKEITLLREEMGNDFLLVCPGIRSCSASNDQRRTASPASALKDGANYIVLGREVTLDKNPSKKLKHILESISY